MSYGFYRMGSSVPGKVMPKIVFNYSFPGPLLSPEKAMRHTVISEVVQQAVPPEMSATLLSSEVIKMSREQAANMGYTGDACDHCGSMKMQRTGHCNTCAECGTTTGCS